MAKKQYEYWVYYPTVQKLYFEYDFKFDGTEAINAECGIIVGQNNVRDSKGTITGLSTPSIFDKRYYYIYILYTTSGGQERIEYFSQLPAPKGAGL